MSGPWPDGPKAARANQEIEAGVAELHAAFARILGGISLHREAIPIVPIMPKLTSMLEDERSRVETEVNQVQSTIAELATSLERLGGLGSTVVQTILATDERGARDIWGASPDAWRDQELPGLPPGTAMPDAPPQG